MTNSSATNRTASMTNSTAGASGRCLIESAGVFFATHPAEARRKWSNVIFDAHVFDSSAEAQRFIDRSVGDDAVQMRHATIVPDFRDRLVGGR